MENEASGPRNARRFRNLAKLFQNTSALEFEATVCSKATHEAAVLLFSQAEGLGPGERATALQENAKLQPDLISATGKLCSGKGSYLP